MTEPATPATPDVAGMNYIDVIATAIQRKAGDAGEPLDLYRIYAVLALTTGPQTTNRHVHDAWAAWCAGTNPRHRSLVPFDSLTPEVQALDQPYTDAICATAREFWGECSR